MKDEVARVLKMVENGQINAAQAEQLLCAMEGPEVRAPVGTQGKVLRLRIEAVENGKPTKVNINLPIGLLEAGLGIAKKVGPKNVNDSKVLDDIKIEEIMALVNNGAVGEIMNVDSEEAQVRIYVD